MEVLGAAAFRVPDQEDVITYLVSYLASDHFKEVRGRVRSNEQQLGRLVVGIDLIRRTSPCQSRAICPLGCTHASGLSLGPGASPGVVYYENHKSDPGSSQTGNLACDPRAIKARQPNGQKRTTAGHSQPRTSNAHGWRLTRSTQSWMWWSGAGWNCHLPLFREKEEPIVPLAKVSIAVVPHLVDQAAHSDGHGG